MARWRESRSASEKAAKDRCNGRLVKMAVRHLCAHGARLKVLALDGPGMRTTRAMIQTLPAETLRTMYIPQWDRATALVMQKRLRSVVGTSAPSPAVRVTNCSMHALLQRTGIIARRSISLAFFDYMGSASGCKKSGCMPMQDLDVFLRNKCADSAVLGFTFSARGTAVQRNGCGMRRHIMRDFLKPALRSHGFDVIDASGCTYKRAARSAPMVFWSMYVTRQLRRSSRRAAA